MSDGELQSDLNLNLTLDLLVRTIGELPVAPVVLARAIQLTSDTESDIKELARILGADQSLSAKVLRLSNSPYYGRLRTVTSITEALQVLGFDTVRTVTIAASTHSAFLDLSQDPQSRTLWQHSICTAVGARKLAAEFRHGDMEVAYIAGLLHDIGKLVTNTRAPHLFEKIVLEVVTSGRAFCDVENELLEFNHADIASLLLANWNFPSQLVKAVQLHHRLGLPPSPSANQLSQIIALADNIAIRLGICFAGQIPASIVWKIAERGTELDELRLQTLAESIRIAYEAEIAMF